MTDEVARLQAIQNRREELLSLGFRLGSAVQADSQDELIALDAEERRIQDDLNSQSV